MQPVEDKQTRRQLAEGGPRTSTALQGRQPTNHGWEAKKRTNASKQQKTELGKSQTSSLTDTSAGTAARG